MKRICTLILFVFVCCYASAQTQQGIVKTRGRMVNGQVVPGARLTGATVTLNFGNPLVSGQNGAFSFDVPSGKNYSLVTVRKQGYTLADPEFTRRSFSYSAKNPFYVVLEDDVQRQADINAVTRKVRKTMNAQLEKREEEVEVLKAQNKITEQEYQRRIKELYDAQEQSQQLVKEMAERYASTDYDQLDEFQQQIQMYIEEGELLKADSMIQSKGSLDKRIKDYHDAVSANKKERERLEQSESATTKTYDELSQDLYSKHTIAIQNYQWGEALFYLKQRADLDTTNIDAVWEYAYLCNQQHRFTDCEIYYHICLRAFTNYNDTLNLATIQSNLGYLYEAMVDHAKSEFYFKAALDNIMELFFQNPLVYIERFTRMQANMGYFHMRIGDAVNAEGYFKAALDNYEQLFMLDPNTYRARIAELQRLMWHYCSDREKAKSYLDAAVENYNILFEENPDVYRYDVVWVQNDMGGFYRYSDWTSSEKYYMLALENLECLFNQNPDKHRVDLASIHENIGGLYRNIQDYSNSEKHYLEALKYREEQYRISPNTCLGELAMTQDCLGNLYCDMHNFLKSEEYYKLALENREVVLYNNMSMPNKLVERFRGDLAWTQYNLGNLYYIIDDYTNAEKHFMQSLNNRDTLFQLNPDTYRFDLATTQNYLGKVFSQLKNYKYSEKYYKLAVENYEQLFKLNPNAYRLDFANSLNGYTNSFACQNRYDEAVVTIDKAITLMPNDAYLYDTKGEIFLRQGKNEEALAMWKKVLELYPDFLKENPDGTVLSNGLKNLGLI